MESSRWRLVLSSSSSWFLRCWSCTPFFSSFSLSSSSSTCSWGGRRREWICGGKKAVLVPVLSCCPRSPGGICLSMALVWTKPSQAEGWPTTTLKNLRKKSLFHYKGGSLGWDVDVLGPQASLGWLLLSCRLLCVCLEKLSGLYKPMSQEKIKKGIWEKENTEAPQGCPEVLSSKGQRTLNSKTSSVAGAGDLVPSSAGRRSHGRDTPASRSSSEPGWEEVAITSREQGVLKWGRLIAEPLCQMCSCRYWIALSLRRRWRRGGDAWRSQK